MLRTIEIGSCISVQGIYAGKSPSGKAIVRVGDKTYEGTLISANR